MSIYSLEEPPAVSEAASKPTGAVQSTPFECRRLHAFAARFDAAGPLFGSDVRVRLLDAKRNLVVVAGAGPNAVCNPTDAYAAGPDDDLAPAEQLQALFRDAMNDGLIEKTRIVFTGSCYDDIEMMETNITLEPLPNDLQVTLERRVHRRDAGGELRSERFAPEILNSEGVRRRDAENVIAVF